MVLFALVKHAGDGCLTSVNCFIWVYTVAEEGVTNQSGKFSVIYTPTRPPEHNINVLLNNHAILIDF